MRTLFSGIAALVLAFTLGACGDSSGPTTIQSVGQITVDGTQNRSQAIFLGRYDWANSNINDANFPAHPQGIRAEAMVLVAFNRSISSENADAEIRARGFRAANLDECLAYGAAVARARGIYNLAPPSNPIVCLGQSAQVDGNRCVPGFWSGFGYWRLDLGRWASDWRSDFRFLAART